MVWVHFILLLILVASLVPLTVVARFFKGGDEELQVEVRFWRWVLLKLPEETATEPVASEVSPTGTDVASESKPEQKPEASSIAEASVKNEQAPSAKSEPKASANPEISAPTVATDDALSAKARKALERDRQEALDNRLYARLALDPALEMQALRLMKAMLVNFFRIFKLRVPELQVSLGMEDPAKLGWIAAGIWTAQATFNAPKAWDFYPAWHTQGLAGAQGEVRLSVNLARIVQFLLASLFSLTRLAWIGFWIWRQFKRDPEAQSLSTWRRFVLNKQAPLIPEVLHDQA